MTKQELCQLLEKHLCINYNRLEINAINNNLWTGLAGLRKLGLAEADDDYTFNTIIEQLRLGKPIQYIIGITCFYGLDLDVTNDVLIPRPETEELVSWIIEDTKRNSAPLQVLDIGTGSGCIAMVLKKYRPHWLVDGLDVSEKALSIAKRNAEKHTLEINFYLMDFLKDKIDLKNTYDLIVSNPPYISVKEMNLISNSVLRYEPHQALFAEGDDSLIFYREIATWAKAHLNKNGSMYLEMNEFTFNEIHNIFLQTGYTKIIMRDDLQGKKRMIKVEF